METSVLISFLIACAVSSSYAGIIPHEETNDVFFSEMDFEMLKNHEIYVYDDDNNLVPLTLNKDDKINKLDENLEEYVFFYLYSEDTDKFHTLYLDDEEVLKGSGFDPKKPTRIVTHGWMNSGKSNACVWVRDAYIKHGDYNVIVIDWSRISIKPYIWASSHVKMVGQYVALMLNFLQKHGMDFSTTIMAGHSLGAHVVGLAARNADGKIGYVVGLDPALPGFYLAGPGSRISYEDASYVEIIHTNGGLLGFLSAIGHSDFYPNGGSRQHGCLLDIGGSCSHSRSYEFFAESINSPVGFYGQKCDSFFDYLMGWCEKGEMHLMGGLKNRFSASGTFYLFTGATYPYAKGK